ncbi:MAG: guanylate kinase [Myxococcales bacterium]|nr:guanylate kinase [Myxococcales bacterium]
MNTNPQIPVTLSPGLLLVLSAPSGAGKTTLARMIQKAFPQADFSISYTTRAPRGAERNGVDYHFVDEQTFNQMIDDGQFVEWAEVHGHFYGSSRATVDKAFASRGIAVFDIDVQGGNAIKRKFPDAVLTFILPPSLEELERRLRARGTDADDVIRRRLLAARNEVQKGSDTYDYLIINDRLDDAFRQLESIVIAERSRRGRVDLSALRLQPS